MIQKKQMTKGQKIVTVVILAASALMMGVMFRDNLNAGASKTQLAECFTEEAVLDKAKEAIELFNNREYQAVIDMSEGGMDNFITAEEIAVQCDEILDERGDLVEYKKEQVVGTSDEEGKVYAGAYITAKYNKGKMKFIIGFDEDMKLVQFQFQ